MPWVAQFAEDGRPPRMDGAEPTPFQKSFGNFKKGIDKSPDLWYNKDSQGAVAQESRGGAHFGE